MALVALAQAVATVVVGTAQSVANRQVTAGCVQHELGDRQGADGDPGLC